MHIVGAHHVGTRQRSPFGPLYLGLITTLRDERLYHWTHLQLKLKKLREAVWPAQAHTTRVCQHTVPTRIHSLSRVCQTEQQSQGPSPRSRLAACFPASAHPGEENEASREELGEVGGGEREVGLAG